MVSLLLGWLDCFNNLLMLIILGNYSKEDPIKGMQVFSVQVLAGWLKDGAKQASSRIADSVDSDRWAVRQLHPTRLPAVAERMLVHACRVM